MLILAMPNILYSIFIFFQSINKTGKYSKNKNSKSYKYNLIEFLVHGYSKNNIAWNIPLCYNHRGCSKEEAYCLCGIECIYLRAYFVFG